jgi:hypothetical protein
MAYYSSCYDDDYQSEYYNGESLELLTIMQWFCPRYWYSVAYSSYNYNEHQIFAHDPLPYYDLRSCLKFTQELHALPLLSVSLCVLRMILVLAIMNRRGSLSRIRSPSLTRLSSKNTIQLLLVVAMILLQLTENLFLPRTKFVTLVQRRIRMPYH